jgi:RimJ/RimL family protein N-acetyltransferase
LTRVQSFVLASDEGRIGLLKSFGFGPEGVLREHLFFNGKMQDVALFAWLERGRS